jgi:hypothetical protein
MKRRPQDKQRVPQWHLILHSLSSRRLGQGHGVAFVLLARVLLYFICPLDTSVMAVPLLVASWEPQQPDSIADAAAASANPNPSASLVAEVPVAELSHACIPTTSFRHGSQRYPLPVLARPVIHYDILG